MKRFVYLIIMITIFGLSYCGDDNSKDGEASKLSQSGEKDGSEKLTSSTDAAKSTQSNKSDYLVDDIKFMNKSETTEESKGRITELSDLKKVLEDDFYKAEKFNDNHRKKWDNSVEHFEKQDNK